MKKLILGGFIFLSFSAFTQSNSVKIDLNPVKLVISNYIGISYERKLSDKLSVNGKINFSSKKAIPFGGRLSEYADKYLDTANAAANIFENKFKSSGFTLSLKYFPGDDALKGFYLSPYFGFQKGGVEQFDFNFPDKDIPTTFHGGSVDLGFNFVGAGIGIGNQWVMDNGLTIDVLWLGLGIGSNKISVIGTGYVGLIQAVGLAEFGFKVVGIDIDDLKVKKLNKGESPLYEKGLEELLKKHVNKNLTFTTSYEPIKDSDIIFLCVGTPQDKDGNANLKYLFLAVEKIKEVIDKDKYKIIVIKVTKFRTY